MVLIRAFSRHAKRLSPHHGPTSYRFDPSRWFAILNYGFQADPADADILEALGKLLIDHQKYREALPVAAAFEKAHPEHHHAVAWHAWCKAKLEPDGQPAPVLTFPIHFCVLTRNPAAHRAATIEQCRKECEILNSTFRAADGRALARFTDLAVTSLMLKFPADTDFTGIKARLTLDAGIKAWKALEGPGPKQFPVGATVNGNIYEWDLGVNPWPSSDVTVWIEGLEIDPSTAKFELIIGGVVRRTDTVKYSVEEIVWPQGVQPSPTWNQLPTDQWYGIELKPAWYISKALVDYIQFPSDKGYIETIHPDAPAATGVTTNESPSVRSYTGDFTVSFGYEFEARDPAQIGTYVPTINADKFSFVSNSGVKFGTATRPYDNEPGRDFEIAILDVGSMVDQVGGIPSTIPFDTTGRTIHLNYANEHLTTLMHGVRYGGNLANMVEHYVDDGAGNPDYDAILASQYNAYSGVTSGVMEINATKDENGLYTVTVLVNGVLTYEAAGLTIDGVDKIKLQSHWGSGVRFTNLYMD